MPLSQLLSYPPNVKAIYRSLIIFRPAEDRFLHLSQLLVGKSKLDYILKIPRFQTIAPGGLKPATARLGLEHQDGVRETDEDAACGM